jgi:hypothetical protein
VSAPRASVSSIAKLNCACRRLSVIDPGFTTHVLPWRSISTVAALSACSTDVRQQFATLASHLFIDEAHHLPATTWTSLRDMFKAARIVQFTATPFREDGKLVEGQVVFRYPLARAVQDGYVSKIRSRFVRAANSAKSDQTIALTAIDLLRKDLSDGFPHLLMARVANIARAEDVVKHYQQLAGDLGVVILHSRIGRELIKGRLQSLRSGKNRIVVCVDMLGEGVDLPELKIAAIHDAHRSLAITLQFIGRFARTKGATLGDAKAVANIADATFGNSLRQLYSQDADWTQVLSELSDNASGQHSVREQFFRDFESQSPEIALRNISPKLSLNAYITSSNAWKPEEIVSQFKPEELVAGPYINDPSKTLVIVYRRITPVAWGQVKSLRDVDHHVYVVHWNEAQGVVYVYSSEKPGNIDALVSAIIETSELIRGETVFRTLSGVRRLQFMNVGLRQTVNRRIQFQMSMGRDVGRALTLSDVEKRMKSNLFGFGFEKGKIVGVGCSTKGLVWSNDVASGIDEWIDWATATGTKLINSSISTEKFMQHVVIPSRAQAIPVSQALSVECNLEFDMFETCYFDLTSGHLPIYETDFSIAKSSDPSQLRFSVSSESEDFEYEAELDRAPGSGVRGSRRLA